MFGVMRRGGMNWAAGVVAAMALAAPGVMAQATPAPSQQAEPPAAAAPAASNAMAAPSGPAPIKLFVDATQAPQKILHSHMQIPVQAGALTLYYPEWIPGEHMPDGPIIDVVGMKFSAGNQVIPWRRDLVEMFSIHLDIPAGVTVLNADFDFLLSAPAGGFSAGASATASLDVLSWNQVLLYPAGTPAKDIPFRGQPEAAGGMEVRDGAAFDKAGWGHAGVCGSSADDAGGFAGDFGEIFPGDPTDAGTKPAARD